MYNRRVKYGDFCRSQWKTLNGIKSVENELRTIASLCRPEYEAWICGGILENRDTRDLDIILVGPNNPDRINWLLEQIVRIGFINSIWIDVKYSVSGKLFVPSQWNNKMERKSFTWASYQPEIETSGRLVKYGKMVDGLWQSQQKLPLTKGKGQCDPMKLF